MDEVSYDANWRRDFVVMLPILRKKRLVVRVRRHNLRWCEGMLNEKRAKKGAE